MRNREIARRMLVDAFADYWYWQKLWEKDIYPNYVDVMYGTYDPDKLRDMVFFGEVEGRRRFADGQEDAFLRMGIIDEGETLDIRAEGVKEANRMVVQWLRSYEVKQA